jgi:hypothetical protein
VDHTLRPSTATATHHAGHQVGIRRALDRIPGVLATKEIVHGDLCLPNTMIRVGKDGYPEVGRWEVLHSGHRP